MSAEVHREPADEYWHGAVAAARHQEERAVLDVVLGRVMDVEQNAEARHGDQHGDDGEEEAVVEAIRKVGDEHGKAERGSPRRNGI